MKPIALLILALATMAFIQDACADATEKPELQEFFLFITALDAVVATIIASIIYFC